MTNQAMAIKSWFLHIGGQPQGPFTMDQVVAKYADGIISRDTHIWCEGMAAWATIKDVPEASNAVSGTRQTANPPPPLATAPVAPRSAQELSHLIELNPREVDDRTQAIDAKKLRSAQKEAAKATKVADKAERKAIAIGNSVVGSSSGGGARSVKLILVGLPLLAAAVAGGAVALKLTTVDALKGHLNRLVSALTSPLPAIDDVTTEQYDILRAAAGTDAKNGAQAGVAISTLNPDKPVFYVATNLPEGANLSFALKANPGAVLSEKSVEVRFPLTISKHFAKSKPLHTTDGGPFPMGEYVVTVTEDGDQSAETKAVMAKGRINVSQRFFIGGVRDAAFNAKLDQLHQKQHERALTEYKQAELLTFKLEAQAALLAAATDQISKAKKKPAQKKAWEDFERRWAAGSTEPLEKGVYFPDVFASIHEIWAEQKAIHDLLAKGVTEATLVSAAWSQAALSGNQNSQKVFATKARLAAISKSVDAAQTRPAH